ncbi:MAG TPA: POTRA domain-containing protein, partial [Candidatus Binatia bacterium]|nr:POTRA domain-containing protein [Candidatus Binatia bacterium]
MTPVSATNVGASFKVSGYEVRGNSLLSTHVLTPLFARYTGTNVTMGEVVQAAAALHYEYCKIGYGMMSVAIARDHVANTNDIVTLNVFQTDVPQVVVSGECQLRFTNSPAITPASGEEIAQARAGLEQAMSELKTRDAELKARQADTRIHVVSTNAGPRFAVNHYLISGNTVLVPKTMSQVLTNIDGAFGTNVSFDGVRTVVTELQRAYRERGYVTVAVGLPQQKLTNATVKVQVTEGRLAAINVTGNRYFSSNNVMRALPSLHTNILLNGPIFQAELNRANANRDRQIYPLIGPGPAPGTSALTLKVKDQLPLHGKIEFNNQSSPGTPDERVNASAVYNNLWQRENALGVQYSFSPEEYKQGNQWNLYDLPIVANYSAFYRLPVGNPQPVEDVIASNPGSFGYSEATHRFNLPPPTGQTELTLYGSRSTIDTGVNTLSSSVIYDVPGVRQISRKDDQQDITINEVVGFRLNKPMMEMEAIRPTLSAGLDFKKYSLTDDKTNIFNFSEITRKPDGSLNPPIVSSVNSPVPVTENNVKYLPLALGGNMAWRDRLGAASFGLDMSANLWYWSQTTTTSSDTNGAPVVHAVTGSKSLQSVTGSSESTGYWVILRPSFSQQIELFTNWIASLRADGQWASEPLISNEQFGAGGVNSVRGYHEGEVFGDTGWHVSLEQQTPPHVIGLAYKGA